MLTWENVFLAIYFGTALWCLIKVILESERPPWF